MEGMIDASSKRKSNIIKLLVPAGMAGLVVIIGILALLLAKAKKPAGTTHIPQNTAGNPDTIYKEESKSPPQQQQEQADPEAQKVIDQVIARVKELAQLEGDAIPEVTRVADADSLREKDNSGFYEKASDGDFVVKYPNAIFLYSPSEDKIIEEAEIKSKTEPTQEQE